MRRIAAIGVLCLLSLVTVITTNHFLPEVEAQEPARTLEYCEVVELGNTNFEFIYDSLNDRYILIASWQFACNYNGQLGCTMTTELTVKDYMGTTPNNTLLYNYSGSQAGCGVQGSKQMVYYLEHDPFFDGETYAFEFIVTGVNGNGAQEIVGFDRELDF